MCMMSVSNHTVMSTEFKFITYEYRFQARSEESYWRVVCCLFSKFIENLTY